MLGNGLNLTMKAFKKLNIREFRRMDSVARKKTLSLKSKNIKAPTFFCTKRNPLSRNSQQKSHRNKP